MKLIKPLVVVSMVLIAGCITRPEGPAERIGRGLDEISKGVQDWNIEQNQDRSRNDWRTEQDQKNNDWKLDSDRDEWNSEKERARRRQQYDSSDPSDEYRY